MHHHRPGRAGFATSRFRVLGFACTRGNAIDKCFQTPPTHVYFEDEQRSGAWLWALGHINMYRTRGRGVRGKMSGMNRQTDGRKRGRRDGHMDGQYGRIYIHGHCTWMGIETDTQTGTWTGNMDGQTNRWTTTQTSTWMGIQTQNKQTDGPDGWSDKDTRPTARSA